MLVLPLSSCMRWHTANRLRDAHTVYTGVDIYHPVDGKLYYSPAENTENLIFKDVSFTNYLIAPEVTYRRRSNLINSDGLGNFYPEPDYTQDIPPTGRIHVVKIKRGRSHPDSPEMIPALPDGLKSLPMPPKGKLTFLPAKLPREGGNSTGNSWHYREEGRGKNYSR